MKHKHYDFIVAWAEGQSIQYRLGDTWFDVDNEIGFEKDSPNFNIENLEWRIKPKTVRYRLALMYNKFNSRYYLMTHHNPKSENSPETLPEFVRWYTEWLDGEI